MSELLREIEEDIKRERFEKLWRSFGVAMVWVSVALILATICFVFWQGHIRSVAEEKTSTLLRGIDRLQIEDYKGAVPIFSSLTDDDNSPYYGIAMLRKAQAQELSGDKEGAKKTYETLAAKNSEFSAIASLKNPSSLDAISEKGGIAFADTIKEYKAWKLLADGKQAEAITIFSELANSDKDAPRTIVFRAKEALRVIKSAKNDNTEEKK